MKKICLVALLAMAVVLFGASAVLSAPEAGHDLKAALEKAKAQGKPLFIQLGRETCGFCQNLKSYIKAGSVNIDNYVYVDLDCDNQQVLKEFQELFTVSGTTLPLVVIADSNGKQLAARSGYGKPEDYRAMIESAKK